MFLAGWLLSDHGPKGMPQPQPIAASHSPPLPSVSSLPPPLPFGALVSFSPLGKWRTDDQLCWTGQGRLAGDWNFVLFEDIQMEERGGKRKPKGIKDCWSVVQRGWEVRHGHSVREKEGSSLGQGSKLSKPPSGGLGSSPQHWD